MKTIKEAALDYAEETKDTTNGMFYADCQDAFKAGVEFAQRWIPVEEELPEINIDSSFDAHYKLSSDVIAKSGNSYYIAYYHHNGRVWSVKGTVVHHHITHWRPIELK